MTRRQSITRVVKGARRYSPGFAVEVLLIALSLLAFQALGYSALGFTGVAPKPDVWPIGLLIITVAMGAAEARFGLYRRVWQVAGLQDVIAVVFAVGEAILLITLVNAALPDALRPFRLLVPVIAAPSVVAIIIVYHLRQRLFSRPPQSGNRLLVVIPDRADYATVKALVQHPSPDWNPVAIVTGRPQDLHQTVMGLPVVGVIDELEHWMNITRADGVAFVGTGNGPQEFRELLGMCLTQGRPIFIVPGPGEWLSGSGGTRLRQLSADDLVGRKTREMDVELAREFVQDQVVMVTGAAGSVGAELTRLIASQRPKRLVLIDNNESGLFDIAEEVRVVFMTDLREVLVSVCEPDALRRVFAEESPDVVFHAAAFKHVPMLESHPDQAVLTNVVGTQNTLLCAAAAGVKKFVLISTDKAVAKHSVMGCTKRLCELMILNRPGPMECWAVRFGNVVGSRGSVIPTFERQIQQGGPVTITHPDVIRYMMTIREAASLVVASLCLAKPGHLYMLDMGQPIKILNLAQDLIRSRGLRPGDDIEIVYTGLRAGERLSEELLSSDEGWRPTGHAAILEVVSPSGLRGQDLGWVIEQLRELALAGRNDELVRALKLAVRGKGPAEVEEDEPAVVKRSKVVPPKG